MGNNYEGWVSLRLAENGPSAAGPAVTDVLARRRVGPREGVSSSRRRSGLAWHESVLLSAPWVAATEHGAEAYVWRFDGATRAEEAAESLSSGAPAPDCERWDASSSDVLRALALAVVAACAARQDDCPSLAGPVRVSPAVEDAPDGIEAVVLYAGGIGGSFVALVRSPALRRGGCGSCRRCSPPATTGDSGDASAGP